MQCLARERSSGYREIKLTGHPGILQYAYYSLSNVVLPAPVSPVVHIAFIIEGEAEYKGVKGKAGDVAVYGMNKTPTIGAAEHVTVFIVSMEFWLFYKITGFSPADCREVIHFETSSPFYQLGQRLFGLPFQKMIHTVESAVREMLTHSPYQFNSQMARVHRALNVGFSQGQKCFSHIITDLGISYRQLQRDFNNVLGITPKEYEEIFRFRRAVKLLKQQNIIETANHLGYWDQAHMARTFKKLSGCTPSQIKTNDSLHQLWVG